MKKKLNSLIRLEQVLNVYDENRKWYYLDGYNGYEISNDNIIRSMKHYKKYPFGLLIQPKKNKDGSIINPEDPIFELSNNKNERVQLRLSQIIYIGQHPIRKVTGYPRKTTDLDIAPRNQRCFINKNDYKQQCKSTYIPKFTIIDDDKICPIESINKGDKTIWQRKL